MNGLVSESIQSVENDFEFLPSFRVQDTFSVNDLLIWIWKIFQKWPVHNKNVKELFLVQAIWSCTCRIHQNVFHLIWMDIVKQIKQLVLLEELDNAINIDESFVWSLLVLQFMKDFEYHVLLIIFEVVTFLYFLLLVYS